MSAGAPRLPLFKRRAMAGSSDFFLLSPTENSRLSLSSLVFVMNLVIENPNTALSSNQ